MIAFGAKDDGLYEYWKTLTASDLEAAKLEAEDMLNARVTRKYLFSLGFLNPWNQREDD